MDRQTILRLRRGVRRHGPPAIRNVRRTRVQRCPCCERWTLIVAMHPAFALCARCLAPPRYWLIADYLRALDLPRDTDVLELDARSPLRFFLRRRFPNYSRSFYDPHVPRGTVRADGATCQDIAALTLPDASVDLIVSSEVLEHVPDLRAAMAETERVLRPGGLHVFTVPPQRRTRQRARLVDGHIVHLTTPEYHSDPLSQDGILAFWDLGSEDGGKFLSREHLDVSVVVGPAGIAERFVWAARRL